MGAGHEHLLCGSEVRWLSRVWEWREKAISNLKNEDLYLAKHCQEKWWLERFDYLVDIFNMLNTLNTGLKGKKNSILELGSGIQGLAVHLGL